jgi:hypothetical protein
MVPEIHFAGVGTAHFGQPMRQTLQSSGATSDRFSDRDRKCSTAQGTDALPRRPLGTMLKTVRCARHRPVASREI